MRHTGRRIGPPGVAMRIMGRWRVRITDATRSVGVARCSLVPGLTRALVEACSERAGLKTKSARQDEQAFP